MTKHAFSFLTWIAPPYRFICQKACASSDVRAHLEKFLRVDRGHATRAGRGDRLLVVVVLNVSRGEHAGNIRLAAMMRREVTVLIHIQLAAKHFCVGLVADGDEHALDGAAWTIRWFRCCAISYFPRRPWSHPKYLRQLQA